MAVDKASARRFFFIQRPKLGEHFSFEAEEESRTGSRRNTKDYHYRFLEGIELQTKGWVYHPALMIYDVSVEPELEQTIQLATRAKSRTTNQFLRQYALDMNFFQLKPYAFTLFGRRERSTLRTDFATRSDTDADEYGGVIKYDNDTLPFDLSYAHSNRDQRGFFSSEENSDEITFNTEYQRKKSDTLFNANFEKKDRITRGVAVETTNIDGSINNTYKKEGENDQVLTFNSLLSYDWLDSNISSDKSLNVSENVFWRHRKNLSSHYKLEHDNRTRTSQKSTSTAVGAGLEHLLYENLTTTLDAENTRDDFTGGSINITTGNLRFNYNRRIPRGNITLNLGNDYRIQDEDITTDTLLISDEPHVLRNGLAVVLDNEPVDTATIEVTNIAGTIIYLEDIDYVIETVGINTRIKRTLFGGIADGQEVLVSYRFSPEGGFDYSTYSLLYAAGFSLNPLRFWRIDYNYNHFKEYPITGKKSTILNDTITHNAETSLEWGAALASLSFSDLQTATDESSRSWEVELIWRWSTTTFTYEDTSDKQGISTNGWTVEESLNFLLGNRLLLNLSGQLRRALSEREEGRFKEESHSLNSNIQWLVNRWSFLELESFLEKDSSFSINSIDTGFSLSYKWVMGVWQGAIKFSRLNQENRLSDETRKNNLIMFELKRPIF